MPDLKQQLQSIDGGILDPPSVLKGESLKLWYKLAPELHKLGFLTHERKPYLVEYCLAITVARQADRIVNKEGHTLTSANGYPRAHPQVRVSQTAWSRALTLGRKIGIGPLSRQRLKEKDAIAHKHQKQKLECLK